MKCSVRSVVLVSICLALAACSKPVEEKTLAKGNNGDDAGSANEVSRKLPECAQRNKDGTYKHGHACTAEQWVDWQKTQNTQ